MSFVDQNEFRFISFFFFSELIFSQEINSQNANTSSNNNKKCVQSVDATNR